MKLRFLIIALLGITLNTIAQTPSVEKSIWQIQTGLIGVWINNESKLTNSVAIRSEFGLAGFWQFYSSPLFAVV